MKRSQQKQQRGSTGAKQQSASRASASRSVEPLENRTLFAANFVWDGGGANANWTTAANWADDVAPPTDGSATLEFPDVAGQKTNTNNFPAGTKFARVLFSGSGYAITGNGITLLDNVNALDGAGSNRFELDTKVAAGQSNSWGFIANGLARLNVHGDVDNGGNLLSFSGTGITRVYGDVSGSGGIRKFGAGDVLLLGSNSYTGTTTVSEGNLYLNNTSAAGTSGPVVATGGVLRGTGKIGDVTIGDTAKFIPGQTAFGTTVITTGNLSVSSGGALYFNLNGATAGTLYDQLQVHGTVTLDAGSMLSLTLGDNVGPGSSFTLIANDGNDPVGGTFHAMPEGTKFSQGGVTFQISYVGGDGNDVVLTSVAANNPPVNTVPNTQSTLQDTPLVFSDDQANAISVSDPDAGTADVKVTLTVTNGALTLGGAAGLAFSVGDGNANPTMTFTGSLASINAALQGLTYAPAGGFSGNSQLTILTDDQGNSGPGGPQSDTDNVRIIVTDQDQTAVFPTAGNVSATRDIGQTAAIDALAAASDSLGRPLTLEVAQPPASGTAEVDDAGTPLDPSDDFISYTANPGFNGDDSFTYRVSTDQGTTATATVSVTTNAGLAIDQDPDDPSKTALFIVGTDASEQIKITKKKTQLRVLINKVQQNDLIALPTGSLVVIAKGGDDTVKAGPLKSLVQRLYGGDGDDTLTGGKAGDVIVGGAGDDKLKGGGGNDLLIAGDGADKVTGAAGDDVIAAGGGGLTVYTAPHAQAIRDLMNAWSAGSDYAAKVQAITVTGVGNGATTRTLGASTLSDDTSIDSINGSSGNDVFFVNSSGGTAVDKLKKMSAETAVEL